VQEVVGGPVQPSVAGPAIPAAANGTNAIQNSSLENDTNKDGLPDCFWTDSWGNQSYSWTRTTDAHTGSFAERVDVSRYNSGDDKLMPAEDLGACSPTVIPGHQYRITAWYKSSAPVYFAVFSRDTNWLWAYWTSSPAFSAASGWTQATWVTPPIPSNINGLSFGLSIAQNGSLTVDDLGFDDANPTGGGGGADTTPPTSAISCNATTCSSAWYAAPVSVTISAADDPGGSGVAEVVYTLDGSTPSLVNGTAYTGAFSVSTSTTVKYVAYDNAGNMGSVGTQAIGVDTTAPAVTITAPANGATISKKVTITANAADAQSGVASVSFYADGRLLGTDTSAPYSWSWNLAKVSKGQHLLSAVAKDRAGNTSVSPAVTVTVG
jgi:hypothetical protein